MTLHPPANPCPSFPTNLRAVADRHLSTGHSLVFWFGALHVLAQHISPLWHSSSRLSIVLGINRTAQGLVSRGLATLNIRGTTQRVQDRVCLALAGIQLARHPTAYSLSHQIFSAGSPMRAGLFYCILTFLKSFPPGLPGGRL